MLCKVPCCLLSVFGSSVCSLTLLCGCSLRSSCYLEGTRTLYVAASALRANQREIQIVCKYDEQESGIILSIIYIVGEHVGNAQQIKEVWALSTQ